MTLYISMTILVAQGCFQLALGSSSPYARKFTSASASTSALIGFTPLDNASVAVVFQRVVLDVVVFIGSLLATVLSRPPKQRASDLEDTNWQLQPNANAVQRRSQVGWAQRVTISSLQAWRGLPPLITMMVLCCFTVPSSITFVLVLALAWFAYALSHRCAHRSLELYRAVSFGIAQVYVLALTVFQFPEVSDRVSADVARVFGLFQLVRYQTYSDPKPFEPRLVERAWSAWMTPVAYVGLYYIATIPSRQTSYAWNSDTVRLEPTGSVGWQNVSENSDKSDKRGQREADEAAVVNRRRARRARLASSTSTQRTSSNLSMVLDWFSELQLSISMGVLYLREVRSHVLTTAVVN
jgi:hypothetical protein